jgi:predicted small lipoprotein YifL
MLKTSQILFTAIALAGGVLNLSGCGQNGPLYLPVRPSTQTIAPPAPAIAPASSELQSPAPTP